MRSSIRPLVIDGEDMNNKFNNTKSNYPTSRQRLDSHSTRERQALPGNLVCTSCGACYHDKHWYSEDLSLKHSMIVDTEEILCPGCYRVEKEICNGRVVIEGPELAKIRAEMLRVLDRVAHECWLDNPTSRMFDLTDQGDKIELKTTTEWLATRIGKSLKKTYDGLLEIKRSAENDSVYVHWCAIH